MVLKQSSKNRYLAEKENKLFICIVIVTVIILSILIGTITINKNNDFTYLESTLTFLKTFNIILSLLAFISCVISYNRLKKDNIFIISLMYLALAIGILLGQIDYLTFYYEEIKLSNYIVVSTSLLRMFLLIITISPKSKARSVIVNNKKSSIIFVLLYTLLLGIIEHKYNSSIIYNSNNFFIIYNMFLTVVYSVVSVKLFISGLKEKEYLYVVLSSSIFMLALKAMYAIYGITTPSFYVKLMSVAITYICFCIIIVGSFIELYLYISKNKVLNNNLSVFYNLTDNNKHTCMFICTDEGKVLYTNKKVREFYFGTYDVPNNYFDAILKTRMYESGKRDEILKALNETGVWRGIIKIEEENKTIDCTAQLISEFRDSKEIAVSYMDISEEIKTELELEKLKIYDKEKSEFIANMSHELKTPLNIFYSTVQLLDKAADNECSSFKSIYKKYNMSLHTNCKRMLRLINNIMDVSKIDMGILEANFGNYDIVFLVEEVTLSVVNYALSKSINVQFDTNIEEHIIKCDPSMIERAILNLLSNAIKFSEENKNIYVNVVVESKVVKIEVIDEGIGIDDNSKEFIFDRFVQVDKSFNRMNEGSGIGLSIVKAMVNLHGGQVLVDSKENEGSIFTILLPNKIIHNSEMKLYDNDTYNTEVELSDIYEILNT